MTTRGKIVFTLVFLGLVAFGVVRWWDRLAPGAGNGPAPAQASSQAGSGDAATPTQQGAPAAEPAAELVAAQTGAPAIAPPGAFIPKDNTIDLELSEYAGYAGVIAANGGLAPSDTSIFFRRFGFKVRITLSEEESWSALNSGKIAASATTVDVLAVYNRPFQVVVPVQIGFSRGADGIVVRNDIRRLNDLRGRTVVTTQFTEAEFFLRYLAQEAGIEVAPLLDPSDPPDPDRINLVFTADAFTAGDVFLRDVLENRNRLAGCVTWAPKTDEVVSGAGGRARLLTTNKNLLVIADVLVVNKAFADQNPAILAGLAEGILEGNRMVRDQPDAHLDVIGRAFQWDRDQTRAELAKVHLSNLPENLAFFSGAIDAAGSFGGIYQSAVLAYGTRFIPNPVDGDRFLARAPLEAIQAAGTFAGQQVSIAPIRTASKSALENNPLLSKDIRFFFQPNSSDLDGANPENRKLLEGIRQLLTVSPGSTVLLRGHVDDAMIGEFRRQGGESYVRTMALRAMELSRQRAAEIRRLLIETQGIDAARVDMVGRGWEEPAGPDPEKNRRVEVQWFTIE